MAAGVLAAVTLVGPAPAAEAAACSGSTGVTVVVDFGSLGGGIQTTCAPGDPASGLAALSGSGHGYSFVPRQPGLVCQIDGKPNPCNGAPTNAYWAYWHADRGGSWSYSTVGAGSYDPGPGSVEGWAFGAGRRPGIAPPAPAAAPPQSKPAPRPAPAPAPAPRPQPTATPGAGPAAPPAAPAGTSGPGRTGTSSRPAAATTRPGTTPAAPTTKAGTPAGSPATGSAVAGTTGPPASPPPESAASPAIRPVSSTSALGRSLLGAALVAALAVTGFLVVRRRRARPE